MKFSGIDAVTMNVAGNLELTWSSAGASDSKSSDVTYSVYLAEITGAQPSTVKMTSDSPNSQQVVSLSSSDQPKNAGKLLTTTTAQKYVVTEGLENGKLYGFQVIAKSAGKVGDNDRVLSLYYARTEEDTTALTIVRGNFQSATPSASLPYPLTVELTKKGAALAGQIINFSISDGVGTLSASNVVTDATGRAAVMYTAPSVPANSKITAFWDAGKKSADFTVLTSSGGAGMALSVHSGNFQLATVLNSFTQPLKVKLTNGGFPASGKTITFSLASGSGATFSSTTATTDASGFAQVNVTAGATAGAYVIHASYNSDEAFTDFQLIVQADTRHLDIVSGNYQTGDVSTTFSGPLRVRLLASSGVSSPVAGATVAFAVTSGTATLSASTVTTDSSGYAQVNFTAGTAPGTYEVTATQSSATGVLTQVFYLIANAVPDTKHLDVISGNYQTGTVSTTFATPLKVQLFNSSGISSPLSGAAITFAVTSGSATLSASTVTTNASGLAQVNFTAGSAVGNYVVTATYSGTAVTLTQTFNLIATAVPDTKILEVVGGNFQVDANNTMFVNPLQARLRDGSTPVVGQSVAFAITKTPAGATGASLTSATATTNASGIAQVSFTSGSLAGSYEVTATWTDGTTTKTAAFAEVVVIPPAVDNKMLTVVSGNFQVDGQSKAFPNPLKVLLKDGATPMAGESILFVITTKPASATGSSLSAATVTTDASGYAQVTFTSGNKDGSYEITATWTNGTLTKTAVFAEVVQTNVAAASKILKIVASGAGAQPEVTTASLDLVADTLTVKAALYDLTGTTYISDVAVAWSLTGGGFNSADLSGTISNSTSITFDPTRTGSTVLNATYMGSDSTVVGPTDSTGFLTVTTTLVPGVISAAAGTGQTGTVNNTLPINLKVRVMSAGAVAVPGASVNFSNTQGGGVVLTGQPVLTDADGYASASVRLGTTAMTNIFRAAVVGYGSLTYDFAATASSGAAAKLAFSTQPANAFRNFMFLTQPIVVIQDTFGNLITTANYPINLTKGLGAGTFVGTTTATPVNGVATFQNVGWDTQENGITIVANSTPVLTTATSSSLNVAAPLASACATETTNFKTQEGGCKDQSSGLVWSNVTSGTYHNAVWDANVSGASGSDANDNGWTNEYTASTSSCAGSPCDTGSGGYCHDLVLGGYSDWFMPSFSQLSGARANGISSAVTNANTNTWTIDPWDGGNRQVYNLGTNSQYSNNPAHSWNIICARAGTGASPRFPAPTKWAWTTTPTTATVGQTFTVVAQIQTATSAGVNRQNQSATVSLISGTGTLGGTTTVNTDSQGQATFNNLTYSASGEYFTLSVSGNTYASATTSNIFSTSVAGGCSTPDDASFDTYQGGCRDKGTGLIWSKPSTSTGITWHSAFWDAAVVGASQPDVNDNGWSNEYSSTSSSICAAGPCDNASGAYCHDLVESGYSDWRMPTLTQLQTARSNGLHNRVSFGTSQQYWSTDWQDVYHHRYWNYRFFDGVTHAEHGATGRSVVCIRGGTLSAPPYRVEFESTSARCQLGQTCPGVYARIVTSTGAQVNRSGVNVTIAVASGSGNLGGTLTAVTDRVGRALFNNFTFDTSGTATLSLSNNASLVNGQNISLTTNATPGACMVENTNWTTVDGGCKHIPSGKVFSKSTTVTYNWSDAIWDSTTAGSSAPDADDGARLNDYDGTHQTSGKDNLSTAYCHNLSEGGKTDWRVPSNNEFVIISSNNPRSAIAGPAGSAVTANTYFWTATQGTWGYCGDNNKYVFNLFGEVSVNDYNFGKGIGDGCNGARTNYIICVRP